jgi:cytochrome bd ubiquinol oxidase subunit II
VVTGTVLSFEMGLLWPQLTAVFGSAFGLAFAIEIASTLSIPFFVAAVGIVLRGGAYAFSSGTRTHHDLLTVETVLSVSSILTPMAFGMAVRAIAGGR